MQNGEETFSTVHCSDKQSGPVPIKQTCIQTSVRSSNSFSPVYICLKINYDPPCRLIMLKPGKFWVIKHNPCFLCGNCTRGSLVKVIDQRNMQGTVWVNQVKTRWAIWSIRHDSIIFLAAPRVLTLVLARVLVTLAVNQQFIPLSNPLPLLNNSSNQEAFG